MSAPDFENRGVPHGGLWVDRYHIDSMQIAWKNQLFNRATFDLFGRRHPFGGGYFLAAGLAIALDFASTFSFDTSEIEYLRSLNRYDAGFLEWLRRFRFSGDIEAIPEGTIAYANEPLLRVTAPFPEALAVEAGLLHAIGTSSTIATKAARIVQAADGRAVSEFALRRAHHPWLTTRSAVIGGFTSTSNLDAARDLSIPASGTIPHALVTAFASEREAFTAVANSFRSYTLLLDTYDVEKATDTAIEVAKEAYVSRGHRLEAVRLDSGDLGAQAKMVRAKLNRGGQHDTKIVASGDLDEWEIARLVASGAPIDGFGVGGRLVVPGEVSEARPSSIGAVYKLVWLEGAPEPARMKLSADKHTWPGKKQIYRLPGWAGDVISTEDEPGPDHSTPLLVPVMRAGEITPDARPTFRIVCLRARANLAAMPARFGALENPKHYEVSYSEQLTGLRDRARHSILGD
jgi:nicotinate phosphoribosyltransferase